MITARAAHSAIGWFTIRPGHRRTPQGERDAQQVPTPTRGAHWPSGPGQSYWPSEPGRPAPPHVAASAGRAAQPLNAPCARNLAPARNPPKSRRRLGRGHPRSNLWAQGAPGSTRTLAQGIPATPAPRHSGRGAEWRTRRVRLRRVVLTPTRARAEACRLRRVRPPRIGHARSRTHAPSWAASSSRRATSPAGPSTIRSARSVSAVTSVEPTQTSNPSSPSPRSWSTAS